MTRWPQAVEGVILSRGEVKWRGYSACLDILHAKVELDLPEQADPIEILSVDGGYRATDSFEVFPKIERREDGAFRCRFFLHGWRHVNPEALARLARLQPGEKLVACVEMATRAARWRGT